MQDRAEHLVRQPVDPVEHDQRRRDERAVRAGCGQRDAVPHEARRGHLHDVGLERVARVRVDDRADVGRGIGRIADHELVHRAVQTARSRAARCPPARTARAAPSSAGPRCRTPRLQRIDDDLLGERRAVDDHRVLSAGLGDQRNDRRAGGERAWRSRPATVGRSGERDARDARIGDERGADDLAGRPAATRAHQPGRRPRCRQPHGARGDERRLLGGLGGDRVAGGERGGDLAGEDRERKVPRGDAREHAAAVQRQRVRLAGGRGKRDRRVESAARLRRVVAAEVDGFAHFGERRRRASCRLRARAARRSFRARARSRRRRDRGSRRTLAAPRRSHARWPSTSVASARSTVAASASTMVPILRRAVGRIARVARGARRRAARGHRHYRESRAQSPRRDGGVERAHRVLVGEQTPSELRRCRPYRSGGAGNAFAGA